MFLTYLLRELRRRARQAILIALGLALGVGLVITVTAASSGVKNAQAARAALAVRRRHRHHGHPGAGGGQRPFRRLRLRVRRRYRDPAEGWHQDQPEPRDHRPERPIDASSVTTIGQLKNVAAASGALTLTDIKISLTIGNFGGLAATVGWLGRSGGSGGSPSGRGNFKPPVTFTVSGVDLSTGALGPLASARLATGRTFTTADTTLERRGGGLELRGPEQDQGRLDGRDRRLGRQEHHLHGRRHGLDPVGHRLRLLHSAGPGPVPGRREGQGQRHLRGGRELDPDRQCATRRSAS